MKIHFFNPGHETAVLNGSPYYMPPANVVRMQHELAFLPAWYAEGIDIVLVAEYLNYYNYLHKVFPNLPNAMTSSNLGKHNNLEVALWGISPQAVHFFEELGNIYNVDFDIPGWKDEYSYLNSRMVSHDCLLEIVNSMPEISDSILPTFFSELDDIEEKVNLSDKQLLAKAPYSSSGRGLLWLPQTGLTRTERQILHGILKKQRNVSIELVLNKKVDFAMEFMSDGCGNIVFDGYSLFYTNSKGGYESNHIGSQENIKKQITEYVSVDLLKDVQIKLIEILKEKYSHIYKGCIGVDMLIYLEDGEYKLHPCLEINMRYNMGYLAMKLYEKYISAQSEGRFYLDFSLKEEDIYTRHLAMQEKHPALFENSRLKEGYLSLCPVKKESKYWAYIIISKS